jgi:hypothetical protein
VAVVARLMACQVLGGPGLCRMSSCGRSVGPGAHRCVWPAGLELCPFGAGEGAAGDRAGTRAPAGWAHVPAVGFSVGVGGEQPAAVRGERDGEVDGWAGERCADPAAAPEIATRIAVGAGSGQVATRTEKDRRSDDCYTAAPEIATRIAVGAKEKPPFGGVS